MLWTRKDAICPDMKNAVGGEEIEIHTKNNIGGRARRSLRIGGMYRFIMLM